ncbi:unnamed protein product [Caenorhabditis nigoni]
MKFAFLILLISTSLFFQSEAVVDKFVITGKIFCSIPGKINTIKALELWESDGFGDLWPFARMGDDHLKANIAFHEEKPGAYNFAIEGEDDGDQIGDYELYIRALNDCTPAGEQYWTDYSVAGRVDKPGDETRYYPNQNFNLDYRYKRSVSGRDDNQH